MKHISTDIAIIGGGISGSWLAYRLAQRGLPVVLVQAETELDTPMVSRGAAIVINKQLLEDNADFEELFVDETETQHPELQPMVKRYLRQEFDELSRLMEFMTLDTVVIPKHPVLFPRLGAGGDAISLIHERFQALGGSIIQGRVTHLAVSDGVCSGLQYEQHGVAQILQCNALVIASGGFSGILPEAPTKNAGAMLGLFAQSGGTLANLEFSHRHALGDLTNGRVLYPPDLMGARMYRDGKRAEWLEQAYATYPEEKRDLMIFQQYWTHNMDVPHTLERGDISFALGPIYGLAMGGIAHSYSASSVSNIYTTGEARHDLAADCIVGRPWACYLSTAGMLCDQLSKRSGSTSEQEIALQPISSPVRPELVLEIKQRLRAFQDHRFSEPGVEQFASWCRQTRQSSQPEQSGDVQTLILAEAYALSMLARRESRGYFFRADFPIADPTLSHHLTLARYDCETDRVVVELVPQQAYFDHLNSSSREAF